MHGVIMKIEKQTVHPFSRPTS